MNQSTIFFFLFFNNMFVDLPQIAQLKEKMLENVNIIKIFTNLEVADEHESWIRINETAQQLSNLLNRSFN